MTKATNGVDTAAVAQLLAGLMAGGHLSARKTGKLARAGRKSKSKGRAKLSDEDKKLAATANEQEAIAESVKRGYPDPKPRENILTAKAWIAKGFVPKKGEKAIKVGTGIPLFHEAQVTPVVPEGETQH